jgi:hypothetical protein
MNNEALLKANTASAIIKMVTGFEPLIIERPEGGALITFNEADRREVTALIEKTITKAIKAPPGDMSLDILPVLSPLAIKYLLPLIIGLVLIGAIGGYFIGYSK